ncbi:GntR family transcriptional regulator [Synergistaceae bacterium OttesenSCG-928-D05]|nr:GntR family transcriptional regulator [Synergistaceae bacterium OttesenSCG-928-D05]
MKPPNLSSKVYLDIKYMLMTLSFPPGTQIREQLVADKLGVSRTPVREAFQRLAHEGWLQIGQGKRVIVSPVTVKDIDDIFQLRMLLEPYALEETFRKEQSRMLAGELDRLLNIMQQVKVDRVAFAQLDMDFHALLMQNADNKRLTRFWKNLHEETSRIAIMTLQNGDGGSDRRTPYVVQEHIEILNSLWDKDLSHSLNALNKHLINSKNALFEKMGVPLDTYGEVSKSTNIIDLNTILSQLK